MGGGSFLGGQSFVIRGVLVGVQFVFDTTLL